MKKLIYLFIATAFLVSCNDDEMAEAFSDSGWLDFSTTSTTTDGMSGEFELPVNVNLGTNLEGQIVQYSVELVSGNVTTSGILGTFSATIPTGDKTGILPIKTSTTDGRYELLVTLLSSSGMYDIGLSDGSKITEHTINVCPSSLAGTYDVVSNGDNTDGQPAAVNLPYTVTVTDNGGGNYSISDGVAGVYIYWYSIYGYTFETVGNFTDNCGNLSGSWMDAFGGTITLTGTDNENGTLTINWENSFGDYCDATYTLQ